MSFGRTLLNVQPLAKFQVTLNENIGVGTTVIELRKRLRYESFIKSQFTSSSIRYESSNLINSRINEYFGLDKVTGRIIVLKPLEFSRLCNRDQLVNICNNCLARCSLSYSIVVFPPARLIIVELTLLDTNDHKPQFPQKHMKVNISENLLPGYRVLIPGAYDGDFGLNGIQLYTIHQKMKKRSMLKKCDDFILRRLIDDDNDSTNFIAPSSSSAIFRNLSRNTYRSSFPSMLVDQLVLQTTRSLDHEVESSYELVIRAYDGNHQFSSMAITVDVMDMNDHSPIPEQWHYKEELLESTSVNTTILRIRATDQDSGRNGLPIYRLQHELLLLHNNEKRQKENESKFPFKINHYTGELSLVYPLDYEEQSLHVFTVQIQDSGANTLPVFVTVTIVIIDENDNDPIIYFKPICCYNQTTSSFQFRENVNPPVTLAILTVRDRDSGNNGLVSYQLINEVYDANNNLVRGDNRNKTKGFTLRPVSNFIYVLMDGGQLTLDREKVSRCRLIIEARDNGLPMSRFTRRFFDVEIVDENDNSPYFQEYRLDFDISETINGNRLLTTIEGFDKDIGENGRLSYEIIHNSHNIPFQINRTTGDIFQIRKLDYEKSIRHQFQIIARDNGSPRRISSPLNITVNVIDENDNVPYFTKPSYYINISENYPINTAISFLNITAIDMDTGKYGKMIFFVNNTQRFTVCIPHHQFPSNEKEYFNRLKSLKSFKLYRFTRDYYETHQHQLTANQPHTLQSISICPIDSLDREIDQLYSFQLIVMNEFDFNKYYLANYELGDFPAPFQSKLESLNISFSQVNLTINLIDENDHLPIIHSIKSNQSWIRNYHSFSYLMEMHGINSTDNSTEMKDKRNILDEKTEKNKELRKIDKIEENEFLFIFDFDDLLSTIIQHMSKFQHLIEMSKDNSSMTFSHFFKTITPFPLLKINASDQDIDDNSRLVYKHYRSINYQSTLSRSMKLGDDSPSKQISPYDLFHISETSGSIYFNSQHFYMILLNIWNKQFPNYSNYLNQTRHLSQMNKSEEIEANLIVDRQKENLDEIKYHNLTIEYSGVYDLIVKVCDKGRPFPLCSKVSIFILFTSIRRDQEIFPKIYDWIRKRRYVHKRLLLADDALNRRHSDNTDRDLLNDHLFVKNGEHQYMVKMNREKLVISGISIGIVIVLLIAFIILALILKARNTNNSTIHTRRRTLHNNDLTMYSAIVPSTSSGEATYYSEKTTRTNYSCSSDNSTTYASGKSRVNDWKKNHTKKSERDRYKIFKSSKNLHGKISMKRKKKKFRKKLDDDFEQMERIRNKNDQDYYATQLKNDEKDSDVRLISSISSTSTELISTSQKTPQPIEQMKLLPQCSILMRNGEKNDKKEEQQLPQQLYAYTSSADEEVINLLGGASSKAPLACQESSEHYESANYTQLNSPKSCEKNKSITFISDRTKTGASNNEQYYRYESEDIEQSSSPVRQSLRDGTCHQHVNLCESLSKNDSGRTTVEETRLNDNQKLENSPTDHLEIILSHNHHTKKMTDKTTENGDIADTDSCFTLNSNTKPLTLNVNHMQSGKLFNLTSLTQQLNPSNYQTPPIPLSEEQMMINNNHHHLNSIIIPNNHYRHISNNTNSIIPNSNDGNFNHSLIYDQTDLNNISWDEMFFASDSIPLESDTTSIKSAYQPFLSSEKNFLSYRSNFTLPATVSQSDYSQSNNYLFSNDKELHPSNIFPPPPPSSSIMNQHIQLDGQHNTEQQTFDDRSEKSYSNSNYRKYYRLSYFDTSLTSDGDNTASSLMACNDEVNSDRSMSSNQSTNHSGKQLEILQQQSHLGTLTKSLRETIVKNQGNDSAYWPSSGIATNSSSESNRNDSMSISPSFLLNSVELTLRSLQC
ncbi:hypothetical protein SNEBB_010979 [Seison nebaliae]|nr:hypothetical protein SNEBB_010979 [Seison nebaliae]